MFRRAVTHLLSFRIPDEQLIVITENRCVTTVRSVPRRSRRRSRAQVAELVDALRSGRSDRKVVEVRVLSWAHEVDGFSLVARVGWCLLVAKVVAKIG